MAVLTKTLLVAGLISTAAAWGPLTVLPTPDTLRPAPDTIEQARALHALSRLTFGPRPGDVDSVVAMGVDRFIAQQLTPEKITDDVVRRRLTSLEVLRTSPEDLARIYLEEQRARRQRQLAAGRDSARMDPDDAPRPGRGQQSSLNRARRLAGELQQAAVVRATLSERQLYEVMADFWTNHFNVFLGKGADRFLVPDYIEHTIRPNALGKFEDLLIATAHSPAMLFYLDNVQSVAPGSRPPQLERMERAQRARMGRPGVGRRPPAFPRRSPGPEQMDSLRARIEQRSPKGINENYARELMELHTLGVDGGYTQQDVINVARILTGWSMRPPPQGARFVFNDWAHDKGEKVVLGRTFPAGRGQEEGTERTGGDIREVLRAIFRAPEFWAPEYRAAKVKTPLEFVVSAVRAVGGTPDSTLALAQVIARLGQPLYLDQPPTGYPETQESWVNSGALLERLNVAMGIAAGRAPGVTADAHALIPTWSDPNQLADLVNRRILNGAATPNTLRVIREQTANLAPDQARVMAVGLALGSPEFQRQ